jgi:hypothetical protein
VKLDRVKLDSRERIIREAVSRPWRSRMMISKERSR